VANTARITTVQNWEFKIQE